MNSEEILPIVKGLILMNVFGFRLREANFWNRVHHKITGEEINIDAFKIMRLATADELFNDEYEETRESINRLSIERPDVFSIMKDQVEKLNELMK